MKIYGISGLGADKRVFQFLQLEHELIPIEWIKPLKEEKIEDYAQRLSRQISPERPFAILGVSFGGIIATEISKRLKPDHTILISSAETKHEFRWIVRAFGKTNIIKLIPEFLFDPPRFLMHFLFGTKKKELLNSILTDTDPAFTNWALGEIITWKNEQKLDNCLKISGTNDKLIPPLKGNDIIRINGAEHFMIVDRADEVSGIINESLKDN